MRRLVGSLLLFAAVASVTYVIAIRVALALIEP